MNGFIDTHAHLYQQDFDFDLDQIHGRMVEENVMHVILPNVDVASFEPMKQRVIHYPNIYKAAVGLHPCYVKNDYEEQLAQLKARKNEIPVVAIGEIGLDYYWDLTYKNEQLKALEWQLDWAIQEKLPVLLHCRESLDDVMEMVLPKNSVGLTGIFHCFSGDYEQAKKIVDQGFFLGIGGTYTYKKSNLPQVIESIGIEHIVLETDSPYLPPVPHRGKRNEPSYVALVAKSIAATLDISLDEIMRVTTQNARSLFKI